MARYVTTRGDNKRRFPGAEMWDKTPRWLRLTLMWAFGLALLAVIFLFLAVAFAARSLPSYDELKAAQTAQTIVVRAADGSEIFELGPSYGEWLDQDQIPDEMKQAMVAVEDRRFYSHFGVDICTEIDLWLTTLKYCGSDFLPSLLPIWVLQGDACKDDGAECSTNSDCAGPSSNVSRYDVIDRLLLPLARTRTCFVTKSSAC